MNRLGSVHINKTDTRAQYLFFERRQYLLESDGSYLLKRKGDKKILDREFGFLVDLLLIALVGAIWCVYDIRA